VRDILVDRPPPWLAALPHPFGKLGANPACAVEEVFGIISLIRSQHLESYARSTPLIRADVQCVQQSDELGPLVTMSGRGARGQRHARGIREAR